MPPAGIPASYSATRRAKAEMKRLKAGAKALALLFGAVYILR